MYPAPSALATVAVASLLRGGARAPPPPPPPQIGLGLQEPYEAFFRLNEPIRFFVSGNAGNVVFYYIERLVAMLLTNYAALPTNVQEYQDSLSFFIAYMIQVVSQHWLHALLVYGLHTINTREKYFKTLLGQYSAYMGSLVGSTLLNTFFIKVLELNKTVAFIVTLWTFACVNYFLIGWIVRKGQEPSLTRQEQQRLDATMAKAKAAAKAKKEKELAAKKKKADQGKAALERKRKIEKQTKEKAADAAKKVAVMRKKKDELAKKKAATAKKLVNKPRGGATTAMVSNSSLRSCLTSDEASLHRFVVSMSDPVWIED